jgi:hypothetical protein
VTEAVWVYSARKGNDVKYFALDFSHQARTIVHAPYGKDYADAKAKIKANAPKADFVFGRTVDGGNVVPAMSFIREDELISFEKDLRAVSEKLKIGTYQDIRMAFPGIVVFDKNF